MDINAKLQILSLAQNTAHGTMTLTTTPQQAAAAVKVIYDEMVSLIEPAEK